MDAPSWLVTLTCTRCGAPGRFLDDRLIAICEYCGHIIGAHRALAAGHENVAFAEIRSFGIPTLADARRLELADRKYAALEAKDAATLHATTLELAALDAFEAGMPPEQVGTWARWTAAIEHVATFSTRTGLFSPKVEDFKTDPARFVAYALKRWTRCYAGLMSDALFPVELATTMSAEAAALDALLASLKSWVLQAPLPAFTTALITLGQRPIHERGTRLLCRTCGAPICAEALATLACTYCRFALEVRRHLWLDALLRATAMANADTVFQRDRAFGVVCMLQNAITMGSNATLPDHLVAAYLAAVEGVARSAILETTAYMLQYHSLGPAETTLVHTIQRLADHVPETIPSPPGRRVGAWIALPPSEAWRRVALRNWRRMLRYSTIPEDQRGMSAVTLVLLPLGKGYLLDAGDAVEFLRATGESLDQIRAAIALHRMGEHDPDKRAFWDATAAAIS